MQIQAVATATDEGTTTVRTATGADTGRVSVQSVHALLDAVCGDGETAQRISAVLAQEDLDPATALALEDSALRARATVARLRRHHHEASALFSSARELVELRDSDVLLRRLLQRAHDLTGTDITYLAERDEMTGELFIRAGLGLVTSAFHDVRVPPGKGLATLVAQTRSAHTTNGYMEDAELDHDSFVDAIVAGEDIVSMAGVPMLLGDQAVGVLVAASRAPRSFSTDEINLLATFADHAAVVLQNSRLMDRARASAKETGVALAQLTAHTAAMERAASLHSELTAAVLRGGSVEDVAGILHAALDRGVLVADRRGVPLVTCGSPWPYGDPEATPPPGLVPAVDESRRSGCLVSVPGGPGVVAVMAGDSLLGSVAVALDGGELDPLDRRSVERAAQIIALLTLQQEAVADAEERVRGALVSDVLEVDSVHRRELLLRARSRGVRIAELRTPVVVVVAPEHRRAALRAANAVAEGTLAGEHAGTLTVLVPTEPPLQAAKAVRDRVRQVVPGPVLVVAGPAGAPETLLERFQMAQRCSRLLVGLDRLDAATSTDGFSPYLAMFGSGRDDLAAYIHHTVGKVMDWDRERSTDLMLTLREFVEANASPTRTARNLGLHTNTVLQRLDRISALLGPDWRDPEPLFRVSVAVRLHRLSEQVGAPLP